MTALEKYKPNTASSEMIYCFNNVNTATLSALEASDCSCPKCLGNPQFQVQL
jgi:hypothetical protein